MSSFLKKILSGVNLLPLYPQGWRFIFVFHDIDQDRTPHYSPEHYSTTLDRFREQIDFLKSTFEIVSLKTLLGNELDTREHYAAITFDDGFASVRELAHPILSAYGVPYTCFINRAACMLNRLWISDIVLGTFEHYLRNADLQQFSGWTVENLKASAVFNNALPLYYGTEPYTEYKVYMNEEDLRILIGEGVDFQSHSASHAVLSMLSPELLQRDIEINCELIQSLTHAGAEMFALPFGKKEHYAEIVEQKLKGVGYTRMFTTNPVGFRGQPEFAIPRIGLLDQTPSDIRFMLNRSFLKKIDL